MFNNSLILTRNQFNVQIRKLFSLVSLYEPNWSLCSSKNELVLSDNTADSCLFLMKHHQVNVNCSRCSLYNANLDSAIFRDSLLAEDDQSSVHLLLNTKTAITHSLEIQLVYNEAFAVPELFFTFHHSDGSLLSPEAVEQFVRIQSPFFPADSIFVIFFNLLLILPFFTKSKAFFFCSWTQFASWAEGKSSRRGCWLPICPTGPSERRSGERQAASAFADCVLLLPPLQHWPTHAPPTRRRLCRQLRRHLV